MQVLIADKLLPSAASRLTSMETDVFVDPTLKGDRLGEALDAHQSNVLVVRSTKVPRSCSSEVTKGSLSARAPG